MKDRVVLRYVLSVIGLMAAFAAVIALTRCSRDSGTGPTPVVVASPKTDPGTPGATTTASPAPTTTSTPDPASERSYWQPTTNSGAGIFCAVKGSSHNVHLLFTIPGRNDPASIYGEWTGAFTEYGTCSDTPEPNTVAKFPWCGPKKVQIDASLGYGGGAAAGHFMADVPGNDPSCDPCTPKWEELPPEITYTDWGTCTPLLDKAGKATAACQQTRTKTTVIKEKNSCTGEIRVKSTTTTTETQPCECACVPTWVELPPVITYGDWGACEPVPLLQCEPPECQQQRSVLTVISEENTCTHEVREKSRSTSTETRPCECSTSGKCYYRVSCGDQEPTISASCTDRDQQIQCEAAIGRAGDHGIWLNFVSGALHNHCEFNFDGYINQNFQLNPGQSAPGCVNKNDQPQ